MSWKKIIFPPPPKKRADYLSMNTKKATLPNVVVSILTVIALIHWLQNTSGQAELVQLERGASSFLFLIEHPCLGRGTQGTKESLYILLCCRRSRKRRKPLTRSTPCRRPRRSAPCQSQAFPQQSEWNKRNCALHV